MFRPPVAIPENLELPYIFLRGLLWCAVLVLGVLFSLALLFPDFQYNFFFATPKSTKNNLMNPRLMDSTPRLNGKIDSTQTLTVDAGVMGDFSLARVTAVLEKKSELPTQVTATLRRSYRAFLYPTEKPIDVFPREDLFIVDGTYYALRDGILHPFVSEKAYASRYPESFATRENQDFLKRYLVSEDFLGFRVGTLLSFADGVFIVTSDTEIRPVGSADIFLTLGYRFEDVLSASEEDLGIYKRGRIFILGAVHPDGTLFQDTDTKIIYTIENETKRSITDESYKNFLMEKQAPILASESRAEVTTSCILRPGVFPRTLSCKTPIENLRENPGSDYELTLSNPDTEININTLTLSLETKKSTQNVMTLLSQLKQRLFNRFGYGN
ncbi:MAG: hypothetical protein ABI747_02280 [Candidatus Moraniibacteriota bacterium]